MTLKITFLGSGSAFTVGSGNFHSNLLLEVEKESLLIDAGGDLRWSMYALNKNYLDIRNIYISHLHNDHIGGLEWLALNAYFDPHYKDKPHLYASDSIMEDLWTHSLSGGLRTIQTKLASLETFFHVHSIKKHQGFVSCGIAFKLVQMVHIVSEYELMPCYGLMFDYNGTRIFFTSDTQFTQTQLQDYYKEADIIFHDCETADKKSGVHTHYSELMTLPLVLKKKMWLYHYNAGPLPDAKKEGFLGFVNKGQSFIF